MSRMNRRVVEKNMTLSVYQGRDNQIATHAKSLNIKYKFYGFSGDLVETINYW